MCRCRVESVNVFVLPRFDLSTCSSINKQFNKFAHAQTLSRMSSPSGRMYIARQHWNITGYKRIKQRRMSFVLGYLRMILWKISTAISIKHRILATFNEKQKINFDSLYAFNFLFCLPVCQDFFFYNQNYGKQSQRKLRGVTPNTDILFSNGSAILFFKFVIQMYQITNVLIWYTFFVYSKLENNNMAFPSFRRLII